MKSIAQSKTDRRKASPRPTAHPESLEVTLSYLNAKDAESEEAQEHANSSSFALYA